MSMFTRTVNHPTNTPERIDPWMKQCNRCQRPSTVSVLTVGTWMCPCGTLNR